jgi:hypothetical protein
MEILELLKGIDLSTWALIAIGVAVYFTKGDLSKLKVYLDQLLAWLKPKPEPKLEDKVEAILDKVLDRLAPVLAKLTDDKKDSGLKQD